jgi:hypothetical protein
MFYLAHKCIRGGEGLLIPEPCYEGDLQFFPVEVPLVIEEECLDGKLFIAKGGVGPDIHHRLICLVSYNHGCGVDPCFGVEILGNLKVSGWEAQVFPPCVPVDDRSQDEEVHAEQAVGFLDPALQDQFSDPCTTDNFVIDGIGRHDLYLKTEAFPQLLQLLGGPCSTFAEGKVKPHDNPMRGDTIQNNIPDELFRGHASNVFGKGEVDGDIDSQLFQEHHLFSIGGNQGDLQLRVQELNGMRFKGEDHCLTPSFPRLLDDSLDDCLMTEMEAVIVPDGHGRSGKIRSGKGEVINDLHARLPLSLTRVVD